jgi:hypothetical protein
MKTTASVFVATLMCITTGSAKAATADFEDLPLAADSFYNGDPGGLMPGQSHDGSFISGGARFNNLFATDAQFGFSFWNGWSYSNKTDTTTPGFANQYSAFTGGGSGGSAKYGIAFFGAQPPTIELPAGGSPVSIDITNTTYAALSMLHGDAFAKKFGDDRATMGVVETNFPDFFKLTISGTNTVGQAVGSPVDVYLADYRFAADAEDFVLDTWQTVDLTPLAGAAKLNFAIQSSDVGPFGPNTPLYFAADNLVINAIPEPSSLLLVLAAFSVLAASPWLKPFARAKD